MNQKRIFLIYQRLESVPHTLSTRLPTLLGDKILRSMVLSKRQRGCGKPVG